ncbi:hypothetical protein C8R43DRAFT_946407 [Mycena crocata]|nr:hypothetical protein C8R43DRAFT_946407 [Mycena crocata]
MIYFGALAEPGYIDYSIRNGTTYCVHERRPPETRQAGLMGATKTAVASNNIVNPSSDDPKQPYANRYHHKPREYDAPPRGRLLDWFFVWQCTVQVEPSPGNKTAGHWEGKPRRERRDNLFCVDTPMPKSKTPKRREKQKTASTEQELLEQQAAARRAASKRYYQKNQTTVRDKNRLKIQETRLLKKEYRRQWDPPQKSKARKKRLVARGALSSDSEEMDAVRDDSDANDESRSRAATPDGTENEFDDWAGEKDATQLNGEAAAETALTRMYRQAEGVKVMLLTEIDAQESTTTPSHRSDGGRSESPSLLAQRSERSESLSPTGARVIELKARRRLRLEQTAQKEVAENARMEAAILETELAARLKIHVETRHADLFYSRSPWLT